MRTATALVIALLCSIPVFFVSAGGVATASGWYDTRCSSERAIGLSNSVCDYSFKQPFLLKGYSRGGTSTLSYTVRCGNGTEWPMSSATIDRRVWYQRSVKVSGNFKVYGSKGAFIAAGHCLASQGKSPLLLVRLKMGQSATRTSLDIRLDDNLRWGR